MIVTRTPFRLSFCGGGTDFPEFYHQEPGCVVSTSIDKFMYVTLNRKFGGDIRVGYSKTEIVEKPEQIEHPIVREALKLLKVTEVEITSNADIPARTGLGSSASFTVGLLNALHTFRGAPKSPEELAKQGKYIEGELAHEVKGKQDHYIAAHGGFCYIQFNPDETVSVEPISYPYFSELNDSLMLIYIGTRTKSATSILARQTANLKVDLLKEIKNLTLKLKAALTTGCPPAAVGEFLHKNWMAKKELASDISNPQIDYYYSRVLEAGAIGGKLCGAGSGGFLLLYCDKEKQEGVKQALGLRVVPFTFEPRGSCVIYNDTRVY